MVLGSVRMGKSFKDSLKLLEADIQHANSLASEFPREYDGSCLQMRISFSSSAHLFLYLVRWADCSLAGALGLVRILIYKVYVDGTTAMSTHERKASLREFYGIIFPSLLQLQRGVTDTEDKRQKALCMKRYRRRDDFERKQLSDFNVEREEECGICMELNDKIVLPNCNHVMCMKCFYDWNTRSQSCPFCRDSLKKVKSSDLWIYPEKREAVDMATLSRENLRRLFMYTNKLPLVKPDVFFNHYDLHDK
ncbi:E3 ubiquitin-protein ligase AIRP2-like [Typha angustifolia]|uniref:E3 ubiquitin-protein ligase AIRP2-like n=1 Tax=Typha angustifolia TaxID=59011 RepID=UPI003C304AD7